MVYHKYVYFIHKLYHIQISIGFLFESVCMCMCVCAWISMQWKTEDNLRYPFQGLHLCPLRTGLECTT